MSISGVGPMALDTCKASNALNILQVHGTSDLTIRFNGGNLFGVPYPSAEETAANWIAHKQCDGDPEVSSTRLNLDGYVFGAETQVTRFTTECPEVGAIELWEAITSGHTWWFWEEAFDAFFSWFDAHPQSSSCPADRNADGVIDGADLSDILGSWGQPGGDINGDGTTDGSDLATLLGAWGACG
jgi:poly(3-hydroxybutyrate) depolymerase